VPMVLDKERLALEQESRDYYSVNYPELEYHGIIGWEPDPESPEVLSVQNRTQQPFYYPIHLVEPDVHVIEFDLFSSEEHRRVIELALESWEPAVTSSYQRTIEGGNKSEDISIMLVHPGIPLRDTPNQQPRDMASLVIEVKALLRRATEHFRIDLSVFLYDSTASESEPEFILGAELHSGDDGLDSEIVYLEKVRLSKLENTTVFFMKKVEIQIASRTWTVAVIALDNTFEPKILYVILVGKFILVSSVCMSLWTFNNMRRSKTLVAAKRRADLEKTAVIVQSARDAAKAEQELNDYIAHEIRNPLSAAMSACTFVKSAVNERDPLHDKDTILSVRDDVEIIDSSLAFTNDLLRSMLDMHRAVSKTITVQMVLMDVSKDIVQPVVAMLYKRDLGFEILMECPENLLVMTDRLRLKQVLLNLGRNATKFVAKGYVKLGAKIVDGSVQLFVEDSGYGISLDRKKNLFLKFQESLGLMDQGSGMGLCLCKSMIELLNGDIWLDETFDSGVEGYPGTRFVVDLKKMALSEVEYEASLKEDSEWYYNESIPLLSIAIAEETTQLETEAVAAKPPVVVDQAVPSSAPENDVPESGPRIEDAKPQEVEEIKKLPDNLSVLFVDDDMVLRKLFVRSLKKVVNNSWNIQEASNGETALLMVESHHFDIIFMDQYMASVEKQLLGTEATRALRSKGVTSIICGLSANDVEQGFLIAGADLFLLKPFPCQQDKLKKELLRIINSTPKSLFKQALSLQDHTDSTSLLSHSTAADEELKALVTNVISS
jgi:signal transduction histidine kinase/response regulator of citrate/malate metabolism